jgi:hypothetical protein
MSQQECQPATNLNLSQGINGLLASIRSPNVALAVLIDVHTLPPCTDVACLLHCVPTHEAQLFHRLFHKPRLARNPELKLTSITFNCTQRHNSEPWETSAQL